MVHLWCCSVSLRVDFFRYTFGNKLYYDSKYKKKKKPTVKNGGAWRQKNGCRLSGKGTGVLNFHTLSY